MGRSVLSVLPMKRRRAAGPEIGLGHHPAKLGEGGAFPDGS